MKMVAIPTVIVIMLFVLAWHVGDRWANQIEGKKKMDDATARATHLVCQVKSVGLAAIASIIVIPVVIVWMKSRSRREKTAEPGH